MRQKLIWTGLAAAFFVGAGVAGPVGMPQPVLVELFTSEGCSSCPPADALLEVLERTQPVAGAQIIVLSEHVDYWNRIGWTDPYSSAKFSARQEEYVRHFHIAGAYTPQMVVDGRSEFVGSDARAAESAIRSALREQKVPVRVTVEGQTATVEVDASLARKANVYLAHAADSGTSDVLRGENKGRKLHHVAIAGDLRQVGTVDGRSAFQTRVPAGNLVGSRLIAFVQEPGSGRILGAAMYPASR